MRSSQTFCASLFDICGLLERCCATQFFTIAFWADLEFVSALGVGCDVDGTGAVELGS